MRINEVLNVVNKFFKYGEERDRMFNPEAANIADKNKEHYKNGVGVILTPMAEEVRFSNEPKEEARESAGYRGLQSILKLAGLPYDKDVLS